MTWILVGLGCIAIFAFNLYNLLTAWKRDFGRVTRGDVAMHCLFAALLPVGFIVALIQLNSKRWQAFWGKQVL